MEIEYRKQPIKYLKKIDLATYDKINKAITGLTELKGDIIKLKGTNNLYRLKIYHYRIIFTLDIESDTIIIEEINTRGNIY